MALHIKEMKMKKLFKILRLPEKIPCDKRMHALIGVTLMAFMLIFTTSLYILLGLLVFVAWGIEYFQLKTKSGTYDNLDAIAVVIGGLIALAPYLIRG